MIRRPPSSPLFPYTPLFRSHGLPPLRLAPRLRRVRRGWPAHREGAPQAVLRRPLRRGREGARGHLQLAAADRSEEHTSELQSRQYLVCRLLLEKKKNREQQM